MTDTSQLLQLQNTSDKLHKLLPNWRITRFSESVGELVSIYHELAKIEKLPKSVRRDELIDQISIYLDFNPSYAIDRLTSGLPTLIRELQAVVDQDHAVHAKAQDSIMCQRYMDDFVELYDKAFNFIKYLDDKKLKNL